MSNWTGSDLGAPRPGDRQTLALERIAAALEALVPLVRGLGDQGERYQYLLRRRNSTREIARDLNHRYMESPNDDHSLAAALADAQAAAAEAADALRAFEAAHSESRETR